MTIKEIAELCGRAQSTIRNWITSANSAGLSAKIADAQETKKPANFTTEETIAIVRAGKEGNTTPEMKQTGEVEIAAELRKFKAMVDEGLITQEDFEKKKAALLGL